MTEIATERLFVALWPTPPVRDAIAGVADALPDATGRFVPPVNYHLTLAFLGAVPVTAREPLLGAIRAVTLAPFELRLAELGHWPRSRVVWLGPAECPAPLRSLVERLAAALAGLGHAAPAEPFRPHVTLVRRARERPPTAAFEPVNWPVDGFVLVRSDTRPTGPVYTVLEHVAAGG
jgi:2'-5' RNA ligase